VRLPQIDSPAVESVVDAESGDPPIIVVVGGVDPGGGAGLLRDVATVAALGARPHAVETAWTEQGPSLHRVEPRAPDAVRAALAESLATLRPAAVKIGMAVGPATATAIVAALGDYLGPVVVDPVLATSRGGALWAGAPCELLPLLRRATLVTPNAVEAAALAERPVVTAGNAEAAGRWLIEAEKLRAVLIKGGHLGTDLEQGAATVVDVLVTASGTERFSRPRVRGPSPRGTGCALASAIAVNLGRGRALSAAVAEAGAWLAVLIAEPVTVGDERHLSSAGPERVPRSP
jgi:hydroxymethylpyrimidine kinase/phosphomethylpyrimidine kinase